MRRAVTPHPERLSEEHWNYRQWQEDSRGKHGTRIRDGSQGART